MSTVPFPSQTFVVFKDVKSHVTMLQILEHYGLLASLKRSGDRLSGPCPLHKGTSPTQFRASISRNCWNCFGSCGRGGNVIDFVSLREQVSFRDAALMLQQWFMPEQATSVGAEASPQLSSFSPPAPPNRNAPATSGADDDDSGENPPLSFQLKSLKQDHPYMRERGLTEATITSYGIGYCPRGCLRGYVAIPVLNEQGATVAYIGRWPGEPPEDKPKYKLPKGFKKSLEVFNLDRASQVDASVPLVVVEGIFDCLHLVQLGYPRTVALLGSSLSVRQAALLINAAGPNGHIRLLFDADEAGRKGAADAAAKISPFYPVHVLDVSKFCSQPEQLKREEFEALLRSD